MRLVVLVTLLVTMAACGDSPTGPSAATPPQTLAITSPSDWIFTGESITLTASGTFADGAVRPASARWSVDDSALAAIDSNGRLVGRGAGMATVIAAVGDVSATYPLRVITDHRGTWTGVLRQASCRFWDPRSCGRVWPSNATFGLQLELQQRRDAVEGTFDLAKTYPPGALFVGTAHQRGTARGTLAIDGTLTMEGDALNASGAAIGTMFRWRSRVVDDVLRGGFSLLFPVYNPDLFPLTLEYDIVELRRTP